MSSSKSLGSKPWQSIDNLVADVNSGKQKAQDLVAEAITRAKVDDNNSILEVIEERAIDQAKAVDGAVAAKNPAGKLAGIPFVAKDNFLTFGSKTTAASNILKNFEAPYQATAIERLEAEGAICIGKGNLDAFAHGASTENSDFGATSNPHDQTRVAGGSSGGPAAAVAANIVPFAIGTDTGGSIRQPASFCGVVGLKPSYGRVSRYGVIAMASSTDTIGPLAKTVGDAGIVLEVMSGLDQNDSTTIDRDKNKYDELEADPELKVGIIKDFFTDEVNSGVKEQVKAAIESLNTKKVKVEEINIPLIEYSLAAYYIIVPAEISSNLARYDGIKFGYSDSSANTINDLYLNTRTKGFGNEAKRRIMIGNYVLSSGYYDDYYKKAMQVRTLVTENFNKALNKYDVLVGPVCPNTAFKLGKISDDPLAMYLQDILTVGISLAGLPAISVPVGFANKLPVGMQIIGRHGDDHKVLSAARLVEQVAGGGS